MKVWRGFGAGVADGGVAATGAALTGGTSGAAAAGAGGAAGSGACHCNGDGDGATGSAFATGAGITGAVTIGGVTGAATTGCSGSGLEANGEGPKSKANGSLLSTAAGAAFVASTSPNASLAAAFVRPWRSAFKSSLSNSVSCASIRAVSDSTFEWAAGTVSAARIAGASPSIIGNASSTATTSTVSMLSMASSRIVSLSAAIVSTGDDAGASFGGWGSALKVAGRSGSAGAARSRGRKSSRALKGSLANVPSLSRRDGNGDSLMGFSSRGRSRDVNGAPGTSPPSARGASGRSSTGLGSATCDDFRKASRDMNPRCGIGDGDGVGVADLGAGV